MADNQVAILNNSDLRGLLEKCSERVVSLLPEAHKGQVERFINRAILTLRTSKNSDKLMKCTKESIVTAVLTAAEYGFALDDKFAYAIPYGKECQCQFDYKALIAAAKRGGQIKMIHAQVVYQNDEFEMWDEDGQDHYRFRRALSKRGKRIGAYAIVTIPDGRWHIEFMDAEELAKVRKASKSPNSPAWVNWEDMMYKKAVLKQSLHGFQDDPGLIQMIEHDNAEFDMDKVIVEPHARLAQQLPVGADEIQRKIMVATTQAQLVNASSLIDEAVSKSTIDEADVVTLREAIGAREKELNPPQEKPAKTRKRKKPETEPEPEPKSMAPPNALFPDGGRAAEIVQLIAGLDEPDHFKNMGATMAEAHSNGDITDGEYAELQRLTLVRKNEVGSAVEA